MKAASKAFYVSLCVTIVATLPCNMKYGIDIGDGKMLSNGDIIKNGITFTKENYKEVNGFKIGCICNIMTCVRKCCPVGQYMTNKTCLPTETVFQIPKERRPVLESYHFIFGQECKRRRVRKLLDPIYDNDFVLDEDGNLVIPAENSTFGVKEYCVDYIDDFNDTKALICEFKSVKISDIIGMMISMPFLLLTFIVYSILPKRNLHGKLLMYYVITLFGGYLLLIIVQLYPKSLDLASCKAVGLLTLFFFMVSFFLINVMSIDMWWAFSRFRGFAKTRKDADQKKFLLYSVYTWGVPLLLVVLVTALTHSTSIPLDAWYHPGIGDGVCWFRDEYPALLYFYGPVTILLIINIILFFVTSRNIKRVRKETNILKTSESNTHNYESDKERFNLYLKLMFAMGVNWSMEIISWVVEWRASFVPDFVWYLTDFCNALYGMFIFFVFVCKKKTWILLKRRYYMLTNRSHLDKSMAKLKHTPVHNNSLASTNSQLAVVQYVNSNNSSDDEYRATNNVL